MLRPILMGLYSVPNNTKGINENEGFGKLVPFIGCHYVNDWHFQSNSFH